MAASTGKQWTVRPAKEFGDALKFDSQAPVPQPGPNEVVVRMHNASLNYRDLIIAKVWYGNIGDFSL